MNLLYKNYLTKIENSLGTKLFRNYFAKVDGEEKDVLENGRLSCAVFVSSVLILCGLIEGPPRGPHSVVKSLIKNLEDSGWRKIRQTRPGAILIWEPMKIGKRSNDHVGFFWEDNWAISSRPEIFSPMKHHWTYGTKNGLHKRKVVAIYWHDKLG